MALGALMMMVALLLTFPPESVTWLYDRAPLLAFPGTFLAGIGETMVTLAAITTMCDVEVAVHGRIDPATVTFITGVWLCGWAGFYFLGNVIAGLLKGAVEYSTAAIILSTGCLISGLLCALVSHKLKKAKRMNKQQPLL